MTPRRLTRGGLGVAAALAVAALIALLPATISAQTPTPTATPIVATATPTPAAGITFTGFVPRDGVSLVSMEGAGSPSDIVTALTALDCAPQSVALTNRGAYVVYIPGAPDFVNAAFPTYVSTGTALALRCRAATASSVRTQVMHYVPAKPDASTAQEGTCLAGSVALPARADAFRCMTGNAIHDPCFQLADGSLVCDANPATGDAGFLLTLTGSLPAANAPSADQSATAAKSAWLVQLADGTVCGVNTGATGGVNGERANYGCPSNEWIFGDLIPGDATTPWTAVLGRLNVGANGYSLGAAHQAIIAKVWQ